MGGMGSEVSLTSPWPLAMERAIAAHEDAVQLARSLYLAPWRLAFQYVMLFTVACLLGAPSFEPLAPPTMLVAAGIAVSQAVVLAALLYPPVGRAAHEHLSLN